MAELQAAGVPAEAIRGEKSQFDVVRDGETVFSKQSLGRWPEPGEIVGLLT